MSDLDTAVQLIRQGNVARAQKYLEVIVRTEPNNIPAWLWYAQTFPTDEMRLKVLVACMKFNPGEEKILQAIKLIRAKASGQKNTPANAPISPITSLSPAPQKADEPIEIPSIFAQIQAEQEQTAQAKPAFNWDELDQGSSTPATPAFATPVQTGGSKPAFNWDEIDPEPSPSQPAFAQSTGSPAAFNWDEIEKESAPVSSAADAFFTDQPEASAPKVRPSGRTFKFYEVWWIALTRQSVQAYAELLDDPYAGTGRVVEWTAYTSLLIGALGLGFQIYFYGIFKNNPEFTALLSSISETTLLVWAVIGTLLTPISAILSLFFVSWLQSFIAISIGGKGSFKRTLYAIGSFVTPLQALLFLISIPFFFYYGSVVSNFKAASPPSSAFPIILLCLVPFFLIYILILNTRALQAAMQLSIGKALGTVGGAFIAQIILSCCLNFVVSSILGNVIKSFLPAQ